MAGPCASRSAMGYYIARRVLWSILLLLIVSAVTFVIFYALPTADPAALRAGKSPSPELIKQINHTLGLEKPLYLQFWLFMKPLVPPFHFRFPFPTPQPVRSQIFSRLPATISLTAGAVV